jgi:hypothetical protein
MKRSHASLAAYFVLVFAAGGVVGALSTRVYTATTVSAKSGRRNPEEFRRRYVEEMRTRLKLDGGQVQQLNGILDQTRDKFQSAHDRMEPEMKSIRSEQTERINSMLNEQQKLEFQKMREERDKRMQQLRSGAPGC